MYGAYAANVLEGLTGSSSSGKGADWMAQPDTNLLSSSIEQACQPFLGALGFCFLILFSPKLRVSFSV